jgi:thiamine phosphate synthase YjbQ (UPF0047 family)
MYHWEVMKPLELWIETTPQIVQVTSPLLPKSSQSHHDPMSDRKAERHIAVLAIYCNSVVPIAQST